MGKPMSKKDLVAQLVAESGADRKAVAAVLDALGTVAGKAVASGDGIVVPGIGKLVVRDLPERDVRNPATGATVRKPASKAVKFLVGKALKDSVAG